ncbi:MAG: hypothetical protein IT541_16115 [Hyphomicrobiales bacterium]|nr:hypothetical protein [Hyphomicrobiales bacterium]
MTRSKLVSLFAGKLGISHQDVFDAIDCTHNLEEARELLCKEIDIYSNAQPRQSRYLAQRWVQQMKGAAQ